MGIIHKESTLDFECKQGVVEYALITYDTMYNQQPTHALQFLTGYTGERFTLTDTNVLKLRDFLNSLELT